MNHNPKIKVLILKCIKILIILTQIKIYFSIIFTDPIEKVTLFSSNLQKTIAYWKNILELKIFNQTEKSVLLGYDEDQAKIEFIDIGNLCINNIMILLYILIDNYII